MEKNKLKWILYLFTLVLLSACCKKYKVMNHQNFQFIQDGAPFVEVTKKFGPPCEMVLLRNCIREYRYVLRNSVAPGVVEHVHFIITVEGSGRIINKTIDSFKATKELFKTVIDLDINKAPMVFDCPPAKGRPISKECYMHSCNEPFEMPIEDNISMPNEPYQVDYSEYPSQIGHHEIESYPIENYQIEPYQME